MTAPFATSPLAHRAPLAAAHRAFMRETPFVGLISLRGAPAAIGTGAARALGGALPEGAGQTVEIGDTAIIWLGPDEWLIVTPPDDEETSMSPLAAELTGVHHQMVVLSDYYTALDVGGDRAWQLLAKLVALDLHPCTFPPGTAVATLCAKAGVWLWLRETDKGPVFRLFTRRSHADYVWCLLAEAGREWGLPAEEPIGRVALHLPGAHH